MPEPNSDPNYEFARRIAVYVESVLPSDVTVVREEMRVREDGWTLDVTGPAGERCCIILAPEDERTQMQSNPAREELHDRKY
jgi:hypothetical protein